MEEIIAAVIAVVVSIISAGGSMIVSWLNKRRAESEVEALRKTINEADGEFFITCPYCGKRVRLRDVQVYKDDGTEGNTNGNV